ncbi:hypothetical protein DDT52_01350 [Brenneria roseae subsp. roseae]|nr:hypothetical protein DDT52_01350 [Brenneria roseae subsp. roseae]
MNLKKTIKYVIKNFIITEISIVLIIALWFLYVSFIPEHWMKLMLLSIAIIIFINIKYGSKK